MPNKIDSLFEKKEKNILSIYFTAGFPNLDSTEKIINNLINNGVNMIEIGIPYSDPLADGPIIQRSTEQALKNGMSLKILFKQLKNIGKKIDIPLILMGYLNPIIQFGFEPFMKKAADLGISGLIIPDLPPEDYLKFYQSIYEKYNIYPIYLITPRTNLERIYYLDRISRGFLYMVSSASITGVNLKNSIDQETYFQKIKNLNLKNNRLIGFGIKDNKTFKTACQYASGAIIGSAFINAIKDLKKTTLEKKIKEFIHTVKN